MAKFTTVDDRTDVANATMRVGGHKRLHLAGVGADRNALALESTRGDVVAGTVVGLFNGPKGVWTVQFDAKGKGNAEVRAKLKGEAVASVAVAVVDRVDLPPAATEEGLLARLLLAENRSPGEPGYNATQSKTSMQWMRVVLANRLANNPAQFSASDAKTLRDIITAPGQFEGFPNYPTLSPKLTTRISDVVRIANDDNDARQEAYARFLADALEVAQSKLLVKDPSPTGLYGWRTAGSGSPGPRFAPHGGPLSGNQFYTLKK